MEADGPNQTRSRGESHLRRPPRQRSAWSQALCTLFTLVLLAPSTGAIAAGQATKLREARRACVAGDVKRGIELLAALYEKSQHPSYLQNQARCYEENQRNEEAAERYRTFLREAEQLPKREQATLGLSSDRVEYIKGLIAKLDPPRLPDPIANPPAASLSPAVPADAPALTVTRSSERSPEPGNLLRRTGFAAIAAGGLALAVGSVAGLVARNAQDQIENTREGAPYDVTTDERGRTAATTATVAFVMAPVLIGLGAAALWYGPRLGGEAAAGGEANIVARARTGRGGPSQFKITPIVAGSGTFGATLTGSY